MSTTPDPSPSEPILTQRVGAYGFCLREGRILLTRLSERTGRPGSWTLPGGGVDHGEHPEETVVREAHEETGLQVAVHQVLLVDSSHYIGQLPGGPIDDHHAIRIVYVMTTDDDSAPTVLDVGGSTDAAQWVPLDRLEDFPIVEMVVKSLEKAGFTLV